MILEHDIPVYIYVIKTQLDGVGHALFYVSDGEAFKAYPTACSILKFGKVSLDKDGNVKLTRYNNPVVVLSRDTPAEKALDNSL